MSDLQSHIKDFSKDPLFETEWKALEGEFQAKKTVMSARREAGLTQAELANNTGIRHDKISRIEKGKANTRSILLHGLHKDLVKN